MANVTSVEHVETGVEHIAPGVGLGAGWTQPAGEARSSGVSWGAVIGGAFAAAALYMLLLALGAGFGLSAISPWSNMGASASTVGAVAIAWLIAIEIIASGFGGYLTGRLRTKWALIHTDEVYFRDTANGFLAWAIALVVSMTFLASAGAFMAGHIAQSGASAGATGVADPNAYFIDTLFRSEQIVPPATVSTAQAEAGRILANALRENQIPADDQAYLARLVAARTGLSQPEADKRVSDVMAEARQAEDTARKDTARVLLWFFLALLMGAFSASFCATVGGRQRDHVKAV